MDPWKEQAALQAGRDQLREWAAIEGKSTAMSDDLYRAQADSARRQSLSLLSAFAHVGVWILEIFRFFRSG
jgi:hypothetical protein